MRKTLRLTLATLAVMGLFAVNNVIMYNLIKDPAYAYTAGQTKVYTGKLIVNSNKAYQYALEGKGINIITGNKAYYDTLVGKTVDVTVKYTGVGSKFTIVSVNPGTSVTTTPTVTTTPVTGATGSSTGYLRAAPSGSGFTYYLRSANDDTSTLLRRVIVSSTSKTAWDALINKKVTLTYKYTQAANGKMTFWNATIAAV
jgi:hypothetical protein